MRLVAIYSFIITFSLSSIGMAASIFDQFSTWSAQYADGSESVREQMEAQGITLAQARRVEMLSMIRTNPEEALMLVVSDEVRQELPGTIKRFLEVSVSGVANNSPFRPAAPGAAPSHARDIIIKGETFRAYVYGDKLPLLDFSGVELNGIAIGSEMAVECDSSVPLCGSPYATAAATTEDREASLSVQYAFSRDDLTIGNKNGFDTLALVGCENLEDEPGSPWVPALFKEVDLPFGAEVDSLSFSVREIKVAEGLNLYPVQPPVALSDTNLVFTPPNPQIYGSSGSCPTLAVEQLGAANRLRGKSALPVRINPLRYVPATGELYLLEAIEITVNYIEPLAMQQATLDAPTAVCDYLVITSDALISSFQTLANHRQSFSGLTTEIISTNWITANYSGTRPDGGSDAQTAIRNCIKDYVATKGTTYVVLGGDNTIVPDRDCYVKATSSEEAFDMPTDLYYAGLDGNWDDWNANGIYGEVNVGGVGSQDEGDLVADVYVGRIPIRNSTQANAYINKLIAYENNPPANIQGKLIASGHLLWNTYSGAERPSDAMYDGHLPFDIANHPTVEEEEMWLRRMIRDIIQPGWTPKMIAYMFSTLTSWDGKNAGSYAANNSNLVTKYNEGWQFLFNATHGNTSILSTEGAHFDTSNASSLTNLTSVFYTIACISGAFDKGNPCMSEAMLNNPNGGALVYLGCSRYGWGSPDAPPASNSSTGGTSCNYMREFARLLFQNKMTDMGELFYKHKENVGKNALGSPSTVRWVMFGLNLQGDPAFQIPLETQLMEVVVDHDAIEIPEGGTATFRVRLNKAPINPQTVTISRTSGDADISVSGGASLTFTSANWNTYQTVTLAAAQDADALKGVATITCSMTDGASATVTATEGDDEFNNPPVVAITAPVQQKVVITDGRGVILGGTVTDDGKPSASVSQLWSVQSGPSGSAIASPTALSTAITFPSTGTYVVRLAASDTEKMAYDEITIEVGAAAAPPAEALSLNFSPVDSSTILYYPLDQTSGSSIIDASGNGNTAPLTGGSWQPSGGIVGGALLFDGIDDVAHIPDTPALNTAPCAQRTITLWFNASDVSGRQMIYEEGGGTRGLNIYLDNDTLYFGGWNNGENAWSTTFLTSSGIVAGTWYHVAMVLDTEQELRNDGFRAYLNGTLIGSGNGAELNPHSDDIALGAILVNTFCHDGTLPSDNNFAGMIDEVAFFNRALSDEEIRDLGMVPMVARYAFDGNMIDAFGGDHNGSQTGGTWGSGIWNGAYWLDGVDDQMALPSCYEINTAPSIGKRTIALWFRPADLVGKQVIYEEGGTSRGLNIYLNGSTLYVGGWNGGENGWDSTFLTQTGVTAGQWHHVALVLDAKLEMKPNALRGYFNGALFGSGNGAALNAHNDGNGVGATDGETLCHDGSTSGAFYAGAIEELQIYNRALSAEQISELAALPAGINAGVDQDVVNTTTVTGTVACVNTPVVLWQQTTGAGTASFGTAGQLQSSVSFDATGAYALRLLASVGGLTLFDDVGVGVLLDSDLDGMSDEWEIKHGLNPFSNTGNDGADADNDGDGLSNLEEYLADTNPESADSALMLIGCTPTSSGLSLVWQGGEEACQELEYTTSLAPPIVWHPIYTNLPPTTLTNEVTSPVSDEARFYRIRAYRP